MSYTEWKEINIDISKIILDYDNPRVFVNDPTQENLLKFLIDEEGSIELANQININRGLPPAEKPVVILENGQYIVVEGNRRISACKILYDRSLLNKNDMDKVPVIDDQMKNYLQNIPVVLAPSRDAAEPFITSRHAGEKGIKRWSTIATTKRYINRYRKGESVNHVSRVLGETPAEVRKGIRFYLFLEYVRNELSWTDEEKKYLEIYKMETTRLDRFLPFSNKAKEILKIEFLADQTITTTLSIDKFNKALKIIIERIYLKNEIDTRSKMENVFTPEIINICNDSETGAGPNGTGTGPNGTGAGPNGTGASPGGTGAGPGGTGAGPGGTGAGPGGTGAGPTGGRSATELEKYKYLSGAYPFTNRYKDNKRINTILKEIKNTEYKDSRMSSMYQIRSLLETYTHEYIDFFVKLDDRSTKLKGIAKERTKRNQTLRELLFDHIKIHLKQVFPEYEEEIELIEITFTENNSTAATRIINFYIHSQTQVPDVHELLDAWKKVSKIVNCFDEILCNKISR